MELAFLNGSQWHTPPEFDKNWLYNWSEIRYMIKVNPETNNPERRLFIERRRFQYSQHIPERRSDRRNNFAVPWLTPANDCKVVRNWKWSSCEIHLNSREMATHKK
jgi:hypothetical protein